MPGAFSMTSQFGSVPTRALPSLSSTGSCSPFGKSSFIGIASISRQDKNYKNILFDIACDTEADVIQTDVGGERIRIRDRFLGLRQPAAPFDDEVAAGAADVGRRAAAARGHPLAHVAVDVKHAAGAFEFADRRSRCVAIVAIAAGAA